MERSEWTARTRGVQLLTFYLIIRYLNPEQFVEAIAPAADAKIARSKQVS
jgi:hypothetical protein